MPTNLPNKQLKKEAKAIPYHIQRPISNLKRQLKDLTLKQWQFERDYGDTGRTTHKCFLQVETCRLVRCKLITQIYAGHGAFPIYLHRFVQKGGMGMRGVANPKTGKNHLNNLPTNTSTQSAQRNTKQQTALPPPVANNKHFQTKGKAVIR